MTTHSKLRELREKAMKASVGLWRRDMHRPEKIIYYTKEGVMHIVCDTTFCHNSVENGLYIEAFQPTTILSLLDELDAMKLRVEECEEVVKYYADKENYNGKEYPTGNYVSDVIHMEDTEELVKKQYFGGKRARDYLSKYKGDV